MTEMMSGVDDTEDATEAGTPGLDGLDEQLISQLVDRAKAGGLQLTGEGGVLQQLTNLLDDLTSLADKMIDSAMDEHSASRGPNSAQCPTQ